MCSKLTSFSPRQEYLWIELLRSLTNAQRFAITAQMTQLERDRSRRRIAAANPDLTPEELKLKFIEVHYGKQLAENVRQYQQTRANT